MSSTGASPNLEPEHADNVGVEPLLVALIGPNAERRSTVAKALSDTGRVTVREFDSYPPELEHLQRLLASFDVIVFDMDSDPEAALKLVEKANANDAAAIMGYSERTDPKLAVRVMRAGASEYLLLPLEQGAAAEALVRTEKMVREKATDKSRGRLLVRPERWKILDEQDAQSALQSGETGGADARNTGTSPEAASSNSGRTMQPAKKMDIDRRGLSKEAAQVNPANDESASITILASDDGRATPTFNWPIPVPLSYGDKLGKGQLNAAASVAGTFVYTPGPGSVLPVGKHTLWVTFTPEDANGYSTLQAAIPVVVTKATPAMSWPRPAEVPGGTVLGEAQLNASSSVPGFFDYSPAPGEVLRPGSHTLTVTFTPADRANYNSAEASTVLSVSRATPTILWPTPDPITHGTQLSATQLCAASSVPGSFEYSPGFGAVLAAGRHKLSVVFTPSDPAEYATAQTAVSLTVAKTTPVVTWAAPGQISHGVALCADQLNAKASLPGSFVYTPSAGEVIGAGVHELSVTFTPTDTLNYKAVSAVVSLTVTEKLSPVITWPAPALVPYGTALGAGQLNATASVPGTFVYTPSAGHVLAPGRYALSASFTPSDTEKHATAQATVVLEVEGTPDFAPTPVEATETPSSWTFTAINSAADSAPGNTTRERADDKTSERETRVYKGAVYEKGKDGQWHLQKK